MMKEPCKNASNNVKSAGTWVAVGAFLASATILTVLSAKVIAKPKEEQRPNMVIIWGDDIGQSNISAYSHGLMG